MSDKREARVGKELEVIFREVTLASPINRITGELGLDLGLCKIKLIAPEANTSVVYVGKGNADELTYPVLETKYLEFIGDPDKIFAKSATTTDKIEVLLYPFGVMK